MNELVLEIMKIALEKNKEHKNTIFVDYHGHTDQIQVRVYRNGWNADDDPDYNAIAYLSGIYDDKKDREDIQGILKYLKKLED